MSTNPFCSGKIQRDSPKSSHGTNSAAQARLNRKNNAKQIQSKKRQSLVSATRIFNGVDGAPRIAAVIPLSADVNPKAAVTALAESLGESHEGCPEVGSWTMKWVDLSPLCNICAELENFTLELNVSKPPFSL